MRIGVLAVQGNFREHAAMLRRLGAEPVEVRKPEQLEGLDGLIIPGGESTAIMRLVRLYGLEDAIRDFAQAGFRHLRRDDPARPQPPRRARPRGRAQRLRPPGGELRGRPRPRRRRAAAAGRLHPGATCREVGADVEVLAELDGEPVLLREGRVLVASFHPELTDDTRVHERFLDLVREEANVRA
jgi:5'-phosphate synthase pdxT subunit